MKTSTIFFVGSRPCKEDATIWFVHQVYFGFESLYGGQFTLSSQLIILDYPVILPHQCSSTVSLKTYPFIHLTLKLPDQICNSLYCQPYSSYNVNSENLVLDQLIIPQLIYFFIHITNLLDSVLIL